MAKPRAQALEGGDRSLERDGEAYAVGYGRPPQHAQFQPGQSGNPRGRPKRLKSVGQMLREAVSRPITITENGRRKTMTWLEAMFAQTAKAALQGDGKAMDRMMRLLPAIQAAIADASAGEDGPSGASAPTGPAATPAIGSQADRALLAFFADQIARGEMDFAEPPSPTDEVAAAVVGEHDR